jgi:ATP phosphoribosyltransferase regulatory subunit
MTKPKVFEKPTGVKDYLPHAVAKLRRIERSVLECMRLWGYEQIITPALEYYDTVGMASSTSDQKLFKLLDRRGTSIVLRSDMTAPIARVVGSLLKDEAFPIRLSYHGNVFRAFEEEGGRDSEFYQTGVELVGDASPEADAEMIALAVASLKAAGVPAFKIAMGHVGFLNGLFEETLPGLVGEQETLKACLLQRDHVGYRDAIRKLSLDAAWKRELEDILRLRGGQEVCAQALELSSNEGARAAIRHLCDVWDVLEAYGIQEHVLIDLTMIGDFSYYTGMTFEGYASHLGFPVCSGGRYDNLLSQFGRPAHATGFALKTTRILEVVEDAAEERERTLVAYEGSQRQAALAKANRLREQGEIVVTALVSASELEELRASHQEGHASGSGISYCGRTYEKLVSFEDGKDDLA